MRRCDGPMFTSSLAGRQRGVLEIFRLFFFQTSLVSRRRSTTLEFCVLLMRTVGWVGWLALLFVMSRLAPRCALLGWHPEAPLFPWVWFLVCLPRPAAGRLWSRPGIERTDDLLSRHSRWMAWVGARERGAKNKCVCGKVAALSCSELRRYV